MTDSYMLRSPHCIILPLRKGELNFSVSRIMTPCTLKNTHVCRVSRRSPDRDDMDKCWGAKKKKDKKRFGSKRRSAIGRWANTTSRASYQPRSRFWDKPCFASHQAPRGLRGLFRLVHRVHCGKAYARAFYDVVYVGGLTGHPNKWSWRIYVQIEVSVFATLFLRKLKSETTTVGLAIRS